MRVFTVNQLKATNRKAPYPTVSERIETLLASLIILYEELFDMITDKDGDEMKTEQDRFTQQESEIKDFLSSLEERYYELEAEEDNASEASVSAADRSATGLEQVMKAQLEDSKRREEDEKRARREKERITKERSEAKFWAKSKGLKEEAEFISSLATKTPLGTWKDVEDIKVKISMRELKDWEDKVEKIKQR